MKYKFRILLSKLPWLLLLLGIDVFAALLLWLADAQSFCAMVAAIVMFTLLLFALVCWAVIHQEQKRKQAFLDFLVHSDEYHEELLLKTVSAAQKEPICRLGNVLRGRNLAYTQLQTQLSDYEEYVESWAHETKTPLSLLTLLLDNHREELPPAVGFKLDYIRKRMQESIDQMLFYARVKSARKDYLFAYIPIRAFLAELLEDYKPLLEEKRFRIRSSLSDDMVYSDKRGLSFLLGQIISNAVKYCSAEPELCFTSFEKEGCYVLSIRDNGIGVRSCDLPYIFEKGFTGDCGDGRKKATGMGLYLAMEVAKEMNVRLNAASVWGQGFEMQISFPIVRK